ncbi:MDR family MFS transporter [Fredinandcohnia humi]
MKLWRNYPRNLKVLLIAMLINSTGMAFLWPLHTIYITQGMNHSLTDAGFVLMLHSAAEIVGSFLGGYLYDRIRGKRTLLYGGITSAVLLLLISMGLAWPTYILVMIFLGVSIGTIFPPIYALAGSVWIEGGRRSYNLMYLILNIGVAVGTALGGIVAQFSFRYVFWANASSYVIFLLVVWYLLREPQPQAQKSSEEWSRTTLRSIRFHKSPGFISLMVLCMGFMFCWITYIQWQTTISSLMLQFGFTLASYSLLWTVNGLLIIVLQPIIQWLLLRRNIGWAWQLEAGVVLYMVTFFLLSQSQQYSGFLIGMMIMTIGEILIFPLVPAIADHLAPDNRKGIYQGIVNGAANVGRTIGPLFGGLLLDSYLPSVLLYSCVGVGGCALICFITYQRLQYTKGNIELVKVSK